MKISKKKSFVNLVRFIGPKIEINGKVEQVKVETPAEFYTEECLSNNVLVCRKHDRDQLLFLKNFFYMSFGKKEQVQGKMTDFCSTVVTFIGGISTTQILVAEDLHNPATLLKQQITGTDWVKATMYYETQDGVFEVPIQMNLNSILSCTELKN